MAFTEKYSSAAGAGSHDGSSEANAWSWTEAITAINALGAGGAAGLRLNHKGNVTRTASDTYTVGGSSSSPFVIRGYSSTIGDGYQGRTNGNGPLVATNMPTLSYNSTFFPTFAAHTQCESLTISGTRSGNLVTGANPLVMYRCSLANLSSNTAARCVNNINGSLIDCDMTSTSGATACYTMSIAGQKVIGGRINGGGNTGIVLSVGATVVGVTIFNCSIAIDISGSSVPQIHNVTIAGCTTGIKNSIAVMTTVSGALITDCTTGLDNVASTNYMILVGCRFDRNTTNIASGSDYVSLTNYANDTTSATQANEYVNYAGNDFRLNTGSPARAAGLPYYRDIGALQHYEATPVFGGTRFRTR